MQCDDHDPCADLHHQKAGSCATGWRPAQFHFKCNQNAPLTRAIILVGLAAAAVCLSVAAVYAVCYIMHRCERRNYDEIN